MYIVYLFVTVFRDRVNVNMALAIKRILLEAEMDSPTVTSDTTYKYLTSTTKVVTY